MFHYVDHFFASDSDSPYNKLALHFQINNLDLAKSSVDSRMVREIRKGREAVATGDAFHVIYNNAGGPYGSGVLEGIQADSDKVWRESILCQKLLSEATGTRLLFRSTRDKTKLGLRKLCD
jgi:hypothetical protein